MRTIALMNQKGGVGKTTTSVNLAAGLARMGHRVCVIDLDPQGHSSMHLGIEAAKQKATVYDVFSGQAKLVDARRMAAANLWVVPADLDLAAAEMELVDAKNREFVLKRAIREMVAVDPFDYILFDCPPSLGVLTINALTAADEVIIPLQPHFFALQGLSKLLQTTQLISHRLNPQLEVSGVVLCLYESGTRLAADVTDDMTEFLKKAPANAPWAGAKIFDARIRRNIKLAEAPSFGQSIFAYAPSCPGGKDYEALAGEVHALKLTNATADSETTDEPTTIPFSPPGESNSSEAENVAAEGNLADDARSAA
ncbi:ParA family protein [Stratiformator vulcanicus]|uniref:Soj-like protein n=1 Tax=Stratiformator vulcanicus TaxID=2527980 RepID=A0A517R7J7_9PLAN|nr:AAA family ATPase [Stratiformator vulcanicus]QDT39832.1 Soj-like protein [Stratiformator vulcanicus]